jgi:vacuolar-type H+-ATPase subunit H
MSSGVVSIIFGVISITLLILVVRLYFMIHQINSSFAKLGYVLREDSKKYFDEAAEKIVSTNTQMQESYTKIVHDGTVSALSEASQTIEKTLVVAHKDAGDVVLQAREEAQRIVAESRTEAAAQVDQALSRSSDAIQWVMGQYVGQVFTTYQHEAIITKLLDEYINENRIQ